MTILPIFFYIPHLKKGEGRSGSTTTRKKEKKKCLIYTKGVINGSHLKKDLDFLKGSYATC